jgi:hypothetical protein
MRISKHLALLCMIVAPVILTGCGDDDNGVTPTVTFPAASNVLASTTTENSVVLTWEYDATRADSVRIHRNGTHVASVAAGTKTYTDNGLTPNTNYTYRLVALKGTTLSSETSIVVKTTEAGQVLRRASLVGGVTTGKRTLSRDTIYTISGFFFVQPGAVLEIPAGTRLEGDPNAAGSSIVTLRGTATKPSGQLIANGTAAEPIVFTSGKGAGARGRGDWGGIVLSGLADLNVDGKTGSNEGVPGAYGPGGVLAAPKNDDNSGTLRYVRIEFGGTKVTPDNEINGLTLNSVGSATTIEHVQTHMIADDGFEWFGGTVNGKYLVSSGNDDDMFDMDFGYSGRLQFLFGIQDPTLANRGFEIDNDASGSSKEPFTSAMISNVTLIGAGKEKANNEDNDGLYLRRNNRLKIYNALVTNFRYGLIIDGSSTKKNVANGDLMVKNSIINGTKGTYGYLFKDGSNTVISRDSLVGLSGLADIRENVEVSLAGTSFDAPNPIPSTAVLTGAMDPVALDAWFTSASYIGAFAPAGTNWASGWTTFAKN